MYLEGAEPMGLGVEVRESRGGDPKAPGRARGRMETAIAGGRKRCKEGTDRSTHDLGAKVDPLPGTLRRTQHG